MRIRREMTMNRNRSRRFASGLAAVALVGGVLQFGPASAAGSTTTTEPTAQRPLPHDMIEGFADGQVVAFHYALTYYCATMPDSDVDPTAASGNGLAEYEDPLEYQVPQCVAGDSGTGSIPRVGPDGLAPEQEPTLYGIFPSWLADVSNAVTPNILGGVVDSNNPATDLQTQCTQPGPPVTQYQSPDPASCLMHPSVVRSAYSRFDATAAAGNQPEISTLGPHSHIIEGTSHPLQWWHVVAVGVYDRGLWPDNDGHCPAGPPHCLTSLAALRAAQQEPLTSSTSVSTGTMRATATIPSNIYFYFSVLPERPGATAASTQSRTGASVLPRTAMAHPGPESGALCPIKLTL